MKKSTKSDQSESLQWKMPSPVGDLFLVASEHGLQSINWKKQSTTFVKTLKGSNPAIKNLALVVKQLNEYFDLKRTGFDLPLDLMGTDFQIEVWKILARIPYGKTVSYKDVASKLKSKKSFRAVGTANGKNPVCIIIPCHRVIAANGKLGGYSGGLKNKTKLLAIEGSVL